MARTVLLVQPSLQPPGGGGGVAAWTLQALAEVHRVTVLTWQPIEVEAINRFYGTRLRAGAFETLTLPRLWCVPIDRLRIPAALLRSGLMMHYTRRYAHAFDVVIGLHNETDYGRRGIQYVHYPAYLRPRPAVDLRWYHQFAPLLHAYYNIADRLADASVDRIRSNLTLVNSDWTGAQLRRSLGIDGRTLYPPVVAGAPPVPWPVRRRGFVAMGRVSPEKEYERIMRIVARVRQHAPDVTLTIVCTKDVTSRWYFERVRALAATIDPSGEWLAFRWNLSRDEVRTLIATHRYGIHGMREEHFGMAPAEMVRGGMIVWVPNGGGQVEIVGSEPLLRYDDEAQAADQILRVITNPAEEQRLIEYLTVQGARFDVDTFMTSMRSIVETFEA